MYYIGIDVGGMSIKGGIVDENGNIIVKDSVVTKPTQPSDDNTKDIAGLVAKLLEDAGISTDEIAGMGMGVPGTVDPDTDKDFLYLQYFLPRLRFPCGIQKIFRFSRIYRQRRGLRCHRRIGVRRYERRAKCCHGDTRHRRRDRYNCQR